MLVKQKLIAKVPVFNAPEPLQTTIYYIKILSLLTPF